MFPKEAEFRRNTVIICRSVFPRHKRCITWWKRTTGWAWKTDKPQTNISIQGVACTLDRIHITAGNLYDEQPEM